jgi:hypothetical protein
MQFRSKKSSIQLLRTTVGEGGKRGKAEIVGTISRRKLALSDEVAAKLTPEETKEVDSFVANFKTTATMQGKVYAFQLEDIIHEALEAAEHAEGAEREFIMSNLSSAAMDLRRFLKRTQGAKADA